MSRNYTTYDADTGLHTLEGDDYAPSPPLFMLIPKGWGGKTEMNGRVEGSVGEVIFDPPFKIETTKLLYFAQGRRLSKHFHVQKSEIFYLVSGCLEVRLWDKDAEEHQIMMIPGDSLLIPPGLIHQMYGEEESILLEVSTFDSLEDSYRIEKGD